MFIHAQNFFRLMLLRFSYVSASINIPALLSATSHAKHVIFLLPDICNKAMSSIDANNNIAELERKIFENFELKPVYMTAKVRLCHCEIHTAYFEAKNETTNLPIVLIHGFGTGVAYWAPNIQGLTEKYSVYCFDMPGFGQSSRPQFSQDETLAELEMVSAFEDWRKEMQIEKFYLIAHSFGAFFAASYALEHPHRVEHIILVDPWGFPEKPILTEKQIDPQLYMHAISYIISYFNPLSLIRLCGTYGSWVLRKLRPDVGKKFGKDGRVNDDIYEYIALCNRQDPSGERLYKTLTNRSGFAKRPIFGSLDESVRATFIYGGKTFIDPGPALDMQYQKGNTVDVQILRGAGHLVNVDVVRDFNLAILALISKEDLNSSAVTSITTSHVHI